MKKTNIKSKNGVDKSTIIMKKMYIYNQDLVGIVCVRIAHLVMNFHHLKQLLIVWRQKIVAKGPSVHIQTVYTRFDPMYVDQIHKYKNNLGSHCQFVISKNEKRYAN